MNPIYSPDIEFVSKHDVIDLKAIVSGSILSFDAFINKHIDLKQIILDRIKSDKRCYKLLISEFNCVTDMDCIKQWTWCNMGGNSMCVSDYNSDNKQFNTEQWNCGRWQSCKAYGIVCQRVLTKTEYAIAIEMSKGYIDKEIARMRNVSVNTVRNQHNKIFDKLEVYNISGFMRQAILIGLINI